MMMKTLLTMVMISETCNSDSNLIELADSTNHEQHIAAAPPPRTTTFLNREAEGTSQDLVAIPE